MLNPPAPDISEHPPYSVKTAVMLQNWNNLTFLHWRYRPEVLQKLLPKRLQIDTFDGAAWVGLTPFTLSSLRPPPLSPLPWISQFPEMNVRTYVRGPDGERGIWFFTLEADRLLAVAGARLFYGLPYRWAQMRVQRELTTIEYASRRHVGSGRAHIVIRTGSPIAPNKLERFLTARWRLYSTFAGRLTFAPVEHPPWPLKSAVALRLEQNVIQYSGVPVPEGEPLVQFSPGVFARIGRPRFVRYP